MPLKPCRTCGNQCAESVSSCPRCGESNPNKDLKKLKPCTSCKALLTGWEEVCPNCGIPDPTNKIVWRDRIVILVFIIVMGTFLYLIGAFPPRPK